MGLNDVSAPNGLGPICFRCYLTGHKSYNCPNAIVCSDCGLPGHKASECGVSFNLHSGRNRKSWACIAKQQLTTQECDYAEEDYSQLNTTLKSLEAKISGMQSSLLLFMSDKKRSVKEEISSGDICRSSVSSSQFILSNNHDMHVVGPKVKLADVQPCVVDVIYEGEQFTSVSVGRLMGEKFCFLDVLQVPDLPVNILSEYRIRSRGGVIDCERGKHKVLFGRKEDKLKFEYDKGLYIYRGDFG